MRILFCYYAVPAWPAAGGCLSRFGFAAGVAGALAAPPDGRASPFIEARICSSLLCQAIWMLACCTSIMRPDTEFCASSAEPRASA